MRSGLRLLGTMALGAFLLASVASAAGRGDRKHVSTAGAGPPLTKFSVGESTTNSPSKIVAGHDGNIWFIDDNRNGYGKITPSGVVTEWTWSTVDDVNRGVTRLAAGPDGNVWFTLCPGPGSHYVAASIAKVTPAGVWTSYTPSTSYGFQGCPRGITAGPDGNMWFTDGHYVGKITMGGQITEYNTLASNDDLGDIVAGPDGDLWATELGLNRIAQISPSGTLIKLYQLPSDRGPESIVVGPDHNLWFAEVGADMIGKLTTSGVLTEYPTLRGGFAYAGDSAITVGPDGNLWYTQCASGGVAKITPAGVVTEYVTGGLNCPDGIAAGADGNIWFADQTAGQIDRVSPTFVSPPSSPPPTTTPTPKIPGALIAAVKGKGTITGGGINCPGKCTSTFSVPTTGPVPLSMTLHANPAAGYRFAGWFGGVCPLPVFAAGYGWSAKKYSTCKLKISRNYGSYITVSDGGLPASPNAAGAIKVTAKFVRK